MTVVLLDAAGHDGVGRDLGGTDWRDALARAAGASAQESARADERLVASDALSPARGTRTTARDMVDLLELIWADRAARVHAVMARQLTRHRIASAFRSPVRVAARAVAALRDERP
ncbi:serine hydrolase [Embleya sp. MST-111070]|uniref:serine hydrolase n=1 Tax=Embleya sp. MST-111070 TaxID=3398231 RepID=UPI003F73685A